MAVGRRVMEQAKENLNGSPLPEPHAGKNPAAVALGKLGGAKGGAVSPETEGDCQKGGDS